MEEEHHNPLKEEEKKKKVLFHALDILLGFLFLVLIWDAIYLLGGETFPEFFRTLGGMFLLLGEQNVLTSLLMTLGRIILTLVISTFLGSLLGLLAAFFKPLEAFFRPLIYVMTAFPTVSMILFLIIYTKITSYIIVAFLTFPVIYKAVLKGGKDIMEKYSDPLSLEGKNSLKSFVLVLCPLSLPSIFLGVFQASGLALKGEIMGEVFMNYTNAQGLGGMINQAYIDVNMPRLFSLTLLAILTMSLFDLLGVWIKGELEKRYGTKSVKTFHWL
ncbi:MAG: ABC transporter permease subunit [Bacilli bacterium]|jgi:ABC-type nitrate/sulfonate/bicarbonate transport system permease component|nr:ABC transporter permease subunit [Bacilli bacterium]